MLKRLVAASAATLMSLSVLAACGNERDDDTPDTSDATTESASEKPAVGTTPCEYPTGGGQPAKDVEPPPADAPASGEVEVSISTSVGDIAATLDAAKTPCTVNNFVSLAEQSYFDGTECHRLTTQGIFVLQCGDPTATGTGGPGYTIPDEVDGSETYPAGTLAMAKTSLPDSGGSQFFMVYEDTPLPPDYTVFGQVDQAGVKILQDIAAKGTTTGAPDGPPKDRVTLETVIAD